MPSLIWLPHHLLSFCELVCNESQNMCNFVQVFLRDIWPSRADIQEVESKYVIPRMFEVGFLAGNCYDRFVVLGATLLKLGLVIMPWQYIGLHSLFLASKLCARLLSER